MAAPPSQKAHGLGETPAEVDLKPVMGLIVLLIPLLLYTFSFFQVKVSPVDVPKVRSAGGQEGEKELEKPLLLTIKITKVGFTIQMNPDVVGAANANIEIPKKRFGKDMDYDYIALYNTLLKLKKKFPKENLIHFTGDPCIRFQTVINVMDTVRFVRKEKSFKTPEDFLRGAIEMEEKTIKGKTVKVPKTLFQHIDFVTED